MDISRSEGVEHELNRLIERRHDQRLTEERHRPSEELWRESVERYNAERDRQLRTEWAEYHQGQAARHRAVLKALIATHEEQAVKLWKSSRKEQRNGRPFGAIKEMLREGKGGPGCLTTVGKTSGHARGYAPPPGASRTIPRGH